MKNKFTFFICYLIFEMIFLIECKKDERTVPKITTSPAVFQGCSWWKSGGSIVDKGENKIFERGVCWNNKKNPTINDSVCLANEIFDENGQMIMNETFECDLNYNLLYSDTIYLRAYAKTSIGIIYGNEVNFFSASCKPTAEIIEVDSITETSFVVRGIIKSDIDTMSYKRGFYVYGISNHFSLHTDDGSTTGNFSRVISGLRPNVKYKVQAYVIYQGISTSQNYFLITTKPHKTIFNTTLDYGELNDIDGNTYKTVSIGHQTWMAENLKVTHFSNGDEIFFARTADDWIHWDKPKYGEYYNDSCFGKTYGKLYNWNVASDSRNVCPCGWHVPTKPDWDTLINYLGGESIANNKLKEKSSTIWIELNNETTNESGFTAVPGGYRDAIGFVFERVHVDRFQAEGYDGLYWSSTMSTEFPTNPWMVDMGGKLQNVRLGHNFYSTNSGLSIRCVKD